MITLIRLYQVLAWWPGGSPCRFAPTCSDYALGVIDRHGVLKGTLLAARRILRCHPLSSGGYDPVP